MNISFWLNGVYRQEEIEPGMLLIDFLREKRMLQRQKEAVKLQNCGLCTVLVEDRPILSCSTLAARIDGKKSSDDGRNAERSTGIRELSCK